MTSLSRPHATGHQLQQDINCCDPLLLGFKGSDYSSPESSSLAHLFDVPPRWLISCKARHASNLDAHLARGDRLQKPRQGLQRCGFIGDPYCNSEVSRRLSRMFRDRLARLPAGLHYAHVTVTVPDVPVGHLAAARSSVSQEISRALGRGSVRATFDRSGVAGRFLGDHVVFTPAGLWHPHRHILLVAKGDAVTAGNALADAYRDRLARAGHPVVPETVLVTAAPNPADLIAYLTRPWRREPNRDGSLDGTGLAARALQGDATCAAAYRELVEAIARRALFRGAGCLGPAAGEANHG